MPGEAMKVEANGIEIAYETQGPASGPPMLLIMGLGAQLAHWPVALRDGLAARGFRLILIDNRDIGLSTRFDAAGAPDLAAIAGRAVAPPYRIEDMAADAVGVLDALGVDRAHVVGASMGGMIAQMVAANHPDRVLSLTCLMSTSGGPDVSPPSAETLRMVAGLPENGSIEAAVEHNIRLMTVLGSPGHDYDNPVDRAHYRAISERSSYAEGTARQLAAITAAGDQRGTSRRVKAPTVVVHGDADRLVPLKGGQDIAENIADAEFVVIKGLGHDMPPFALQQIEEEIARVAERAVARV